MPQHYKVWVFDGKEYTVEDLAIINNLPITTIFTRDKNARRLNMDITFEYLTQVGRIKHKPLDLKEERYTTYNGVRMDLHQLAEKTGEDYVRLCYRYDVGARGKYLLKKMVYNFPRRVQQAAERKDASHEKPQIPSDSAHYTMDELLGFYKKCQHNLPEEVEEIMCGLADVNPKHGQWLIEELEYEKKKRGLVW